MPAYPNTQKCFRVAFVVVSGQGKTPTAADIAKIDAYRLRFEQWFTVATDGRGTMDTRLNGTGCIVPPSDGGTVIVPDAGVVVDAGSADAGQDAGRTLPPDAGPQEPDAGPPLTADAGPTEDPDAGRVPNKWETRVDMPTSKLRPGCGCTGVGGGLSWVVLLSLGVLARRRRTQR